MNGQMRRLKNKKGQLDSDGGSMFHFGRQRI
jgi:hypothetical protein